MHRYLILFSIFLYLPQSAADCIELPKDKIKFVVKECQVLNPKTNSTLSSYKGEPFADREKFLNEFYRGALVTSKDGQKYVYPTAKSNPCQTFTIGSKVEKMVSTACCDTGAWGKCIFGGSFLYDKGGRPINAFQ